MFLSRKSLPRRTFLRGAGAMFALPLLDAMVPALTAATATAASDASAAVGTIHDVCLIRCAFRTRVTDHYSWTNSAPAPC